MQLRDLTPIQGVIVVAASLALAMLSWRYVETPYRHPKGPDRPFRVFGAAAIALSCLLAIGIGVGTLAAAKIGPSLPDSDPWLVGRCFLENEPAAKWAGSRASAQKVARGRQYCGAIRSPPTIFQACWLPRHYRETLWNIHRPDVRPYCRISHPASRHAEISKFAHLRHNCSLSR